MSELREKYELLSAPGTSINPLKAKEITEFLYAALTILDSKASALMGFDGILIAAATFTVEKQGLVDTQRVVTLIVIIMALFAAALCLFVARISYPFLGKVTIIPGPPRELDYSDEISALDREVGRRTRLYRNAWLLSLIAVTLFMIVFIRSLIRHT